MIVRAQRDKNYSIIKNTVFNDANLSLKAKGLAAFILSKPDHWNITSRGLESQLKEGRDAILTALKELQESGYLVRNKERDDKGQFHIVSTLHEEPVTDAEQTVVGFSGSGVSHRLVNTDKVNTDNDTNVSLATPPTTDLLLTNSLKKKSPINPDVQRLVDTFEVNFGLKLKRGVAQRRAAWNLIKRYGVEMSEQAVLAAAAARQEQYAPHITNLEDLWDKWEKLELFYQKNNAKQAKRRVIIND